MTSPSPEERPRLGPKATEDEPFDAAPVPVRRGLSLRALLPNAITAAALCSGLTGVRFAIAGDWGFAVLAIIFAGVLDGIDGRIARLLNAQSRFGAELDSLADSLSFGTAPAIIVYLWSLQDLSRFGWFAALAFAVCCALRLARFNAQIDTDVQPHKSLGFLTGIPAPVGAGLVFLPFLGGERSPGWRDEARGSLVGLTLSTRPVEIVRAALESIAYRLCLIYRLMEPHLSPRHEIIGGGAGLLSSPAWLRILADVLGRRVTPCAEPEVTGRGTALLALESLGLVPDLAEVPPKMGKSYDPDPARRRRHLEAMERHLDLYQRLDGFALE